MVRCAHAVEDVLGPGPESDESVDGELGHVLLALGPGSLHDVQCPGEAVRRDMGGGVQGPLKIRPGGEPGVEHEGRRWLAVPARADVREPPDQGPKDDMAVPGGPWLLPANCLCFLSHSLSLSLSPPDLLMKKGGLLHVPAIYRTVKPISIVKMLVERIRLRV